MRQDQRRTMVVTKVAVSFPNLILRLLVRWLHVMDFDLLLAENTAVSVKKFCSW